MREIKFRAWDKTTSRMLMPADFQKVDWTKAKDDYDYGLLERFIASNGHIIEYNPERGVCDTHYYLQGEPKYILMQYTGLKDKNGVEIYEGDRVRTTKGIVYEIFYTTKTARWAGKTLNVWTDDINTYFYKALAWLASRCEICGNIYEHPEL